MTKHVSVAEAKARFSAIVDDVLHEDERYVIERRGRAVAVIGPIADLERGPEEPARNGRRAGALALLGAWGDVEDQVIDAFLDDVYAARSRDRGRPVPLR